MWAYIWQKLFLKGREKSPSRCCSTRVLSLMNLEYPFSLQALCNLPCINVKGRRVGCVTLNSVPCEDGIDSYFFFLSLMWAPCIFFFRSKGLLVVVVSLQYIDYALRAFYGCPKQFCVVQNRTTKSCMYWQIYGIKIAYLSFRVMIFAWMNLSWLFSNTSGRLIPLVGGSLMSDVWWRVSEYGNMILTYWILLILHKLLC